MGLVKRLDDQKRAIDAMRTELHQLKSTDASRTSGSARVTRLDDLANSLETALAANKRLVDSMIKIREIISSLTRESKELRKEVDAMRLDGLSLHEEKSLSDTSLRILDTIGTNVKTSADISRIIGRSREHTSRIMSKLLQVGLVQTNSQTYPSRYTLTERGKQLQEI